ncbi:MauE/DoxX family redox-associated membrane protein [Echinicola soli]|nr:MauE/DoxX family redox-associated membrane protein [Echinicola soli]
MAAILYLSLWTFTGMEKLMDYDTYLGEIRNQVFPLAWAERLAPTVLIVELLLAVLLLYKKTRKTALLLSTLLMTAFTTYIGLVWMGAFPRVPFSCAGFLETMGWTGHFLFNTGFVILGIMGLMGPQKTT